jgi:hypothetical protein
VLFKSSFKEYEYPMTAANAVTGDSSCQEDTSKWLVEVYDAVLRSQTCYDLDLVFDHMEDFFSRGTSTRRIGCCLS